MDIKLIDLENLQLYDEEIKKYLQQMINESINAFETVIQKDSFILFPLIGDEKTLYIDKTTNQTYRWSDSETKYYCVGSDWNSITMIDGQF